MKQRGRHRRRRRGAAVRAFLTGTALALTAAATLISVSQADVATGPGALKPLTSPADTGALRLQEHMVPGRTLNRLSAAMGRPVGVDTVLDSADRSMGTGADCSATDRASLPVAPAATRAYCWDPSDAVSTAWRPASVATSGDAADGVRGTHRVILSGWTHSTATGRAAERGLARVAFVDADDLGHLSYRWALLVVPVRGGRDYRGLDSGISGMVWHRDKLLVTTTAGSADALYVYDLDRIQRTTVDGPAIGRVAGGWSADGYRYVLPAVGSYRFTSGRCAPSGPPCPGALALDGATGPGGLVAAEWTAPGSDRPARLWRYAFRTAPEHGGPLAADPAGRVDAAEAYRTRAAGIRGVLPDRRAGAAGASWYLGQLPASRDGHGSLWRQDREGARAAHCGADASHRCWAQAAGSLSYGRGTGEVWSLSDRMLFTLPLTALERSLG
ncbi:hypothetical protein GCM10010503_46600 [Streptomyces lucensis JCM 4490]|uniref:Secreted protein n=1 Tax=Streptomyces lucensis JCM 4490 TaxID=1306176 RepID=A0A918JAK0_9ACTN|nr:hypothetical protein [Streptomyces lucensis]GGW64096.1 hypothetical protein GCM10010503_46600 [Streptomyces lucensis JCM 4490]